MGKRAGFSLVELLVVVAVITILLAILAPSYRRIVVRGQAVQCQNNQHQLLIAYAQWSADRGMRIVSSNTGSGCWVASSSYGGNTLEGIVRGELYQYVQNVRPYRCPTPVYDYYSSYSFSGLLNGEDGGYGSLQLWTHILEPSMTMACMEDDDFRGYNVNSWMIRTGDGEWVDYVAGNHDSGDNLGFCDGHSTYYKWLDPDTLTYPYPPGGGSPGFYGIDRGSVDTAAIQKVYRPW